MALRLWDQRSTQSTPNHRALKHGSSDESHQIGAIAATTPSLQLAPMLDIHTLDKLKEVDGKELQTEDDAILPASTLMAGLRAGSPCFKAENQQTHDSEASEHERREQGCRAHPPPRRLLKSSLINERKSSARAWQVGGRNAWHKLQDDEYDATLPACTAGPRSPTSTACPRSPSLLSLSFPSKRKIGECTPQGVSHQEGQAPTGADKFHPFFRSRTMQKRSLSFYGALETNNFKLRFLIKYSHTVSFFLLVFFKYLEN
jgi:hypothetical protein